MTREDLFRRLAEMGISTTTVDHGAVFTVADADRVADALPGAHTKNLFLKSESGVLVLVVAASDTKVDLKRLGRLLGVGRLSFARPELMATHLGVTPGSVTAFAVANDVDGVVRVVIDETLMHSDAVNCHPLENTATTNIARDDLLRFIRATGREPLVMALSAAM